MSDEPRDPQLETVLQALHDAVLDSVFGAMPGSIVSYDSVTRRASVQPQLQRSHHDENDTRVSQTLPILHDVPVVMLGTAALRIKFPLAAGDPVLIIWCGQSLEAWKKRSSTNIVNDDNDRRNDYADAVCIPGLVDFNHASESAAMIEFTDSTVKIGGNNPLVTKAEFDGHTHDFGTLVCTGGTVSGVTAGAGSVSGTPILRG